MAAQYNTLAALQALQQMIIAQAGSRFAALNAQDAARYGVASAVFIGAPKDLRSAGTPQAQIIPRGAQTELIGAAGRVSSLITVDVRIVVEMTDWWQAEQTILAIYDSLAAALAQHVLGGSSAGGAVTAVQMAAKENAAAFDTMQAAGELYRICVLELNIEQQMVISGGYLP